MTITPTFDSSITGNANSAAIQACIQRAITIFQNLFLDNVTVHILFKYNNDFPGSIGSNSTWQYTVPWATVITALIANGTSSNDTTAIAGLPGSPLSTDIDITGANGRALGLSTPPGMDSSGNPGSSFDSIIVLTSSLSLSWTRPVGGSYDAQSTLEHEIAEVLGLTSNIGFGGNLMPLDLFAWSAPGTRNTTTSGTRYFSINGGTTNIKPWNQDVSAGDSGDWLVGGSCPISNPHVQDYFGCPGQTPPDVSAPTPEGIALDVIGWTISIVIGGSGPGAPTTLAPTSVTATHFVAQWNASSGATGYLLDVSISSIFTTFVPGYQNINVGNLTSHSVSNLLASNTYYYRVRAFNSFGTSGDSNVTNLTTLVAGTDPTHHVSGSGSGSGGSRLPLLVAIPWDVPGTDTRGLADPIPSAVMTPPLMTPFGLGGLDAGGPHFSFRLLDADSDEATDILGSPANSDTSAILVLDGEVNDQAPEEFGNDDYILDCPNDDELDAATGGENDIYLEIFYDIDGTYISSDVDISTPDNLPETSFGHLVIKLGYALNHKFYDALGNPVWDLVEINNTWCGDVNNDLVIPDHYSFQMIDASDEGAAKVLIFDGQVFGPNDSGTLPDGMGNDDYILDVNDADEIWLVITQDTDSNDVTSISINHGSSTPDDIDGTRYVTIGAVSIDFTNAVPAVFCANFLCGDYSIPGPLSVTDDQGSFGGTDGAVDDVDQINFIGGAVVVHHDDGDVNPNSVDVSIGVDVALEDFGDLSEGETEVDTNNRITFDSRYFIIHDNGSGEVQVSLKTSTC
jgi:hypothetical protein